RLARSSTRPIAWSRVCACVSLTVLVSNLPAWSPSTRLRAAATDDPMLELERIGAALLLEDCADCCLDSRDRLARDGAGTLACLASSEFGEVEGDDTRRLRVDRVDGGRDRA